MKMSIGEIAEACGATLPAGLNPSLNVSGVSTDSRRTNPGEIFIGLKGEHFDGADFAAAALQRGAVVALVNHPVDIPAAQQVLVSDTRRLLGCLGGAWRQRLSARVGAVTGSAGKTTTKDLLAAMCAKAGPTVATVGTENNEIGVPQALLRLEEADRFCVLEFGMRGRGEIRRLAEIARPDVGVITLIGDAHLGRLGSREAIAESKAEMLPLLPADGVAVLPADDFFYPLLRGMCNCRIISFGMSEEAAVRPEKILAEDLTGTQARLRVESELMEARVPLPGRHNLLNALAAAAAAVGMGCTMGQIKVGLEAYPGLEMRGQIIGGPAESTIINDTYNASPTSMAAALRLLAQASGRHILVLGDMLELGEAAVRAHRRVGELAAQAGVKLMFTVGELAAIAGEVAAQHGVEVRITNTPEEAADALGPKIEPADIILVKGSRGMQLERTVRLLLDAQ